MRWHGFVWAKHVWVLNKSSPRPSSFSSLAFGLVSFLCAEEPPLRHLYCATTVHGSLSLDNWLHYSNVKVVPWYFCPSRVASFSCCFSLHPITKAWTLDCISFAFILQFPTVEVVSPFRISWLELHGILCIVAKKEHHSYRVCLGRWIAGVLRCQWLMKCCKHCLLYAVEYWTSCSCWYWSLRCWLLLLKPR